MSSYGMLSRMVVVRTDVSEELIASIIRVIKIGEVGTPLVSIYSQRASVACYC
jgi:hypothetical protein